MSPEPKQGRQPAIGRIEVLSNIQYDFLKHVLHTRPVFYPRPIAPTFEDGYQPIHLKCYRTARKVQQLTGNTVIAGIAFLDKVDKLYPWPHMVNSIGPTLADGLVDASPSVREPNLGFVPIRLNETVMWNEITSAYVRLNDFGLAPSWGDLNADRLTQDFLPHLRQLALTARSSAEAFAIPDSIPEIES